MMRFVFSIQSAISHFNPMRPVANELRARGHDVIFATSIHIIEFIESKGFEVITVADAWTPEQVAKRDSYPLPEQGAFDIGVMFADVLPPLVLTALQEYFGDNLPDLIIRDQLEFGGYLAREVLGIPHATLNISAGWQVASEWLSERVIPPLTKYRKHYNLPDVDVLESLSRYLRLDMSPESLLPETYYKTPTTHRFNQFTKVASDVLPEWVATLPHDKTILITLDTVWHENDAHLDTLIKAAQDLPVNVIVATGREETTLDANAYTDNVTITPYIPFTALTPKLSAAVHHGGFVTLLTMLNGGVPSVVTPLAADHFLNGRLVQASQVGKTILPADISITSVRQAIQVILEDETYSNNADRVMQDMHAMHTVHEACDMLEQVARTKQALIAN